MKLTFNKTNIFVLILIIFVLNHLPSALAEENYTPDLNDANFYFLIDANSKEVLLSKNADVKMAPSSMTKLMTAVVVFDQVRKGKISLQNQCMIGKDAWRKSGSSMFLNYGDVVSIDDLVKGLLAVSANDAAIALAESVGQGIGNFIDLMNLKAKELGMKNTHFTNPHGLHEPNHYSSLRDLATLVMYFYEEFNQYANYFSIAEFTYQNITQHNRNPLIKNKYQGTVIGKTGHTNEGGYGVVELVQRDNRTLVAVVNKMKTPRQRAKVITQMMDYGFYGFKKLELYKKNQEIAQLNTWLGEQDKLAVVAKNDVAINVPRYYDLKNIEVSVKYMDPLYAPIKKDSKVATLLIEAKGIKSFELDLFAQQSVDKVGYIRKAYTIAKHKFSNFYNKYFS